MPGFTKVDNPLLERLLTGDLTKRQLKVILLVVRFSAGYQKTYAVLRRKDFAYAGVPASCVAAEVRKLGQMRVLRCDPKRDMYWLNPNLGQWTVKNPVDSQQKFFGIATRNSTKWQLSLLRNMDLSPLKSGGPKERQRKTNKVIEERFLEVVKDYFLQVAPLSAQEAQVLREVVRTHGLRLVQQAIRSVPRESGRTLSQFLKELDALAPDRRRSGFTPLRSSLGRYRRLSP